MQELVDVGELVEGGRRRGVTVDVHPFQILVGRQVRRTNRPADSRSEEWWEVCVADGPSPFEDAAERDLARRLFSLVERLEDGVREVVHLHYYQGLSLSETAEALGIATGTVKYRLRGALDFLRSQTIEPKLRAV